MEEVFNTAEAREWFSKSSMPVMCITVPGMRACSNLEEAERFFAKRGDTTKEKAHEAWAFAVKKVQP